MDNRWHYRNKNNDRNGWKNNLIDVESETIRKDVTKEVAEVGKASCPEKSADDVVANESLVVHICSTGDYRSKGANDRNKARHDNCFTAVLLVERFGLFKVIFLKEARIFTIKQLSSNTTAESVADIVAKDSCEK
ncbi:hypothetical protein D3C87_1623090 [compost metagenome]